MIRQPAILFILFIPFTIGCSDSEFETKIINIVILEIPETGTVNSPISIKIQAHANNGCYSDLKVKFNQKNNTNYQILATGNYYSEATICPAVIVELDTTISFTPTQAGTYYINANQAPFSILRDTITIN